MRPIRLLIIYLIFVFLGAALLSPLLYQSVQIISRHSSLAGKFAGEPFHRSVNRSLLFFAIVGVWPFLRALNISPGRDFGLATFPRHWRNSVAGFLLGFASLAILAIGIVLAGVRTLDFQQTLQTIFMGLFRAATTAVVVAFLEETLYRGAFFGALRKTISWLNALIISSAVFALCHFFGKAESPVVINWLSGFFTLGSMFRGFIDLHALVPGFINLFLVGGILAWAFQRTGNLFFSIGLHAGWIFWLRSLSLLTNKSPAAPSVIWGGSKMIDGWAASVVLLAVLAAVIFKQKQPVYVTH
ncbi:MAG: type II CAAX endopeptidase family protein [Verrucomicrobiota bacterium]